MVLYVRKQSLRRVVPVPLNFPGTHYVQPDPSAQSLVAQLIYRTSCSQLGALRCSEKGLIFSTASLGPRVHV